MRIQIKYFVISLASVIHASGEKESTASSAPTDALTSYMTFQLPTSELQVTPDPIDRDASRLLMEKIWKLVDQGKASLDHTSVTLGRLGSKQTSESIAEVCYAGDWNYNAKDGLSPRSAETRNCGFTDEWAAGPCDSRGRMKLRFVLESVSNGGLREMPSIADWKHSERVSFPCFSSDRINAERLVQSGFWYLVDRKDPVDPYQQSGATSKVSFVRLDIRENVKTEEFKDPVETGTFEWIEVDHLMFSRWLNSSPSALIAASARKQVSSWITEGRARLISSSQLNVNEGKCTIQNIEETAYAAIPLVPGVLEELCNPKDGKKERGSLAEVRNVGRSVEWEISSQGRNQAYGVRIVPEWVMKIQLPVSADSHDSVQVDPFAEPEDPFANQSQNPDGGAGSKANVEDRQSGIVSFGTERVSTSFSANPGESLLVGAIAPLGVTGDIDKQKRHLLFFTLHGHQ